MLTVTDDAREQIIKMLDQMKFKHLRIEVQSGGCSGFRYGFDIVETPEKDDILINIDTGYFIVMDQMTVQYMTGSEIDYKVDLQGSAIVIRNPNATRQCGCGKSFCA